MRTEWPCYCMSTLTAILWLLSRSAAARDTAVARAAWPQGKAKLVWENLEIQKRFVYGR